MMKSAIVKKTLITAAVTVVAATVVSEWSTLQAKAPRVIAKISDAVRTNNYPDVGSLHGEAAILIDERTGKPLFVKNERKRLYPASTTKMLTALIALEKADTNEIVTVGDEVMQQQSDESSAGLVPGQQLSLYDLIAAMMLPSGNDAARTVARFIAEKETGQLLTPDESMKIFAGMMNERAKELGATESHFVNSHGLHDPDHYTTAADLALIARKARKNSVLREIVNESEHHIQDVSDQAVAANADEQIYVNRNKLLQPSSGYYFSGANGMKTGYTSAAGYCLVASAKRGDRGYIAVILKSSSADVWLDATKLLQYGFDNQQNDGYL
ncbi:D-alanyl-D-alanine carboxypeptidase family protein [Paenibacillus sp. GCM10027626]|uniref:D-alanyl-D-alanine carboxypeptidase family protein n=1 Tax=Paenibacillus sp. GCM10027626 TaxID=3273411 RepID=UPI00362E41F8